MARNATASGSGEALVRPSTGQDSLEPATPSDETTASDGRSPTIREAADRHDVGKSLTGFHDRPNPAESRHGAILPKVEAVMRGAAEEGLTLVKDGRITGRVSSALIARAKARTGLRSDTELLEFALANLALEDRFAEAFHEVRGAVDPDLDLEV